ncbi:MAG: hypothetical protein JWN92_3069 [Candidatus Acidoferrum typicum]|nr:hypothetical protein [Candidatus Acidoferrum typicum]
MGVLLFFVLLGALLVILRSRSFLNSAGEVKVCSARSGAEIHHVSDSSLRISEGRGVGEEFS